MKTFTPLLLAAFLLCGCDGPEHVSSAEFKKHYAWVGQPQTMHDVSYLGQRDGRAYIRIRSMSTVSQKEWSDRVIYVELAELDPAFRESLPKRARHATWIHPLAADHRRGFPLSSAKRLGC